ncbi:MAG: DNA adenine methylase [Caulobacteraceae bacterium]|nr:DNA adenine methylase [Caulobacteraceae bacterium]
MKTPFGRTGGKKNLSKRIINLFPNDYNLYVEPFVGAGNIYFKLPKEKQTNPMVINDLDDDVYIALKEIQNNAAFINSNIKRVKFTKDYFEEIKNKNDPISVIEKLKTSYMANGITFNFYHHLIKTDFLPFQEYLKNTIVLNETFEKIIEKYDNKDTFFYLDPPYENNSENDYKHYVNPQDVYNSVKNIKGRFILSYNNSNSIKNLFAEFYIYPIETKYTRPTNKTIELLISNFQLK